MLYFDHNATAPMLPEAREAWVDAVEKYIGNPSSPHRIGSRADAALTAAREELAAHLGCSPLDIVWTSGASESNNMVLHHLSRTLDVSTEVWVSGIEHPSMLSAVAHYLRKRYRLIPALRSGVIDFEWIHSELGNSKPGLIAVMAANNETGVLQPWLEVLSICQKHAIPYFCDASQWVGRLPGTGLGNCDFVSGCAHKFGGPKGVGFLKCPAKGQVHPLIVGGPQEEGRRAGTENVPGVLSMMAALNKRRQQLEAGVHRELAGFKQQFESRILKMLPGSEIVGANQERLWNTVSALMPEADCQQRWVVKLDKLGFAVSTGSACSSGQEKPSHVLSAMGCSAAESSRVLRFSSGWETTAAEWEQLAEGLQEVHRGIKK